MPYTKSKIKVLISVLLTSIIINLFLSVGKYYLGFHFNQLSLIAEAWNNLSDLLAQFLLLFSIYLASLPADKEHPFGHARIEYLSSICLALFITLVAGQIIYKSYEALKLGINIPQKNIASIIILIISIFLKLILIIIYNRAGEKIKSASLLTSATDSLFDVLSSVIILISLIFYHFTNISLDAYLSIALAFWMICSAFKILKDMLSSLIGKDISSIERTKYLQEIKEHKEILSCHDLILHQYGPEAKYMTCHIEVDANLSLEQAHDLADEIETKFMDKYNISLLIHIDPKRHLDPCEEEMKEAIRKYWRQKNPHAWLHDFRIIGNNEDIKKLYFEIMLPYSSNLNEDFEKKEFVIWFEKKYKDFELNFCFEFGDALSYLVQ